MVMRLTALYRRTKEIMNQSLEVQIEELRELPAVALQAKYLELSGKGSGMKAPQPIVRCGIYTHKSTEEGLEQEFNSLMAQREAAEAYILSQRELGWTVVANQYDDGGFSGGNMDRPALMRLLADVEARQIDCVVVYKVDRLSRSLLDFASIIGLLDKHSATFVS